MTWYSRETQQAPPRLIWGPTRVQSTHSTHAFTNLAWSSWAVVCSTTVEDLRWIRCNASSKCHFPTLTWFPLAGYEAACPGRLISTAFSEFIKLLNATDYFRRERINRPSWNFVEWLCDVPWWYPRMVCTLSLQNISIVKIRSKVEGSR